MKLLADENFPSRIISYLQKLGHKIKRISKTTQGVTDTGVLKKALAEKQTIFTFDKGFISNQKKVLVNVVVFDFPTTQSHQLIFSTLDHILLFVQARKKKKKPFILICSGSGIEEVGQK
jgi:predicted nuclease of predicted toxin-antitoxin system